MPEDRELPLVLASRSPRRRDLLSRARVAFEVIPAHVDERPLEGEAPRAHARRLAEAKAQTVSGQLGTAPPRLVLGADTVVVHEGRVLGKPRDPAHALELLRRLAGSAHHVLTAIALVSSDRSCARSDLVESRVVMRAASDAELRAYLATGESLDCAGAYAAQGAGRDLIERIEGSETNVIGLPVAETLALLRGARAQGAAARRGGATREGAAP